MRQKILREGDFSTSLNDAGEDLKAIEHARNEPLYTQEAAEEYIFMNR